MEYWSSGHRTVDQMGTINISGNVIPQNWYRTVTKPKTGKPYLLAIMLLADIVYWYRPTEVRDEASGQVIGWKKRFRGDLLQRNYKQYALLFGESTKTIQRAMAALEGIGVIRRKFRELPIPDQAVMYNVMYIDLNVDVLRKITYPQSIAESKKEEREENCQIIEDDIETEREIINYEEGENNSGEVKMTEDVQSLKKVEDESIHTSEQSCPYPRTEMSIPLDRNVHTPGQKCPYPLDRNVHTPWTKMPIPPDKIVQYTENTTEITNRDYSNPINQGNIEEIKKDDGMDKYAFYRTIVKKKIDYDALDHDCSNYSDRQIIDEIVELIVETVCVERKTVRIAGADYPQELVAEKLLALDVEHIRYVLGCMQKNTSRVGNIKAYLLTALYNASNTIGNYYQAKVNHDIGLT